MLFSFSMATKLIFAGVPSPFRKRLRTDALHFYPESGPPEGLVSQQRADASVVASTLRDRLCWYNSSVQSDEFRIPACKRRLGEPRGNLREIWEDTRLEAMQRLIEHGSAKVENLASPEEQRVLLEALRRLDKPPQHPIAPSGDAIIDTINAPFCAFDYLHDKCTELGAAAATPTSALNSFMERCEFVRLSQQSLATHRLLFPDRNLPTIFSILWDEVTRLAKEIAVVAVFGYPLEIGIKRYLEHLKGKYAQHPRLEECSKQVMVQEAIIRAATTPEDL